MKPALSIPAAVLVALLGEIADAAPRSVATRSAAVRRAPEVVLYHVNRRDTTRLGAGDLRARGAAGKAHGQRLRRFFRCHYTGREHRIDPRLLRLLYQTGRRFPGNRIEVVSGYRSPAVARNPRSPHMKGLACDFRVAGIGNVAVRDYLRRTFKNVGVGYYPNSSFVHLDVRKGPSAFWIDTSGPGEAAAYSPDPSGDLRAGRIGAARMAARAGADGLPTEDDLGH